MLNGEASILWQFATLMQMQNAYFGKRWKQPQKRTYPQTMGSVLSSGYDIVRYGHAGNAGLH